MAALNQSQRLSARTFCSTIALRTNPTALVVSINSRLSRENQLARSVSILRPAVTRRRSVFLVTLLAAVLVSHTSNNRFRAKRYFSVITGANPATLHTSEVQSAGVTTVLSFSGAVGTVKCAWDTGSVNIIANSITATSQVLQ